MTKLTTEEQKIFDKITTKPLWMKNAVLCERGWKNPETGELLLGRRTPDWVLKHIEELSKPVEKEVKKVEVDEIKEESQPEKDVEEVKEEVKEAPKKTTRRRRTTKKETTEE